ncbi:hypothetical protein AB1N83_011890 [Pleurotus pulmonarius]
MLSRNDQAAALLNRSQRSRGCLCSQWRRGESGRRVGTEELRVRLMDACRFAVVSLHTDIGDGLLDRGFRSVLSWISKGEGGRDPRWRGDLLFKRGLRAYEFVRRLSWAISENLPLIPHFLSAQRSPRSPPPVASSPLLSRTPWVSIYRKLPRRGVGHTRGTRMILQQEHNTAGDFFES